MATKKAVKTKTKTKAKPKAKTKPGRPFGATTYIPNGMEVRSESVLSRKNAIKPLKGLRRITVEVGPTDEDSGVKLQTLATLISKKDPSLLRLLKKNSK